MHSIHRVARLAIAFSLSAAFGLLAAPTTTLASCRAIPAVGEALLSADIVFVGTVTATANRDAWATVQVEEVWRGPDQPTTVVIQGGPAGNAATSVDRAFVVGTRYLFFPYAAEGGALTDNSCTSTTEWSGELAALRPADARQPLGATPTDTGFDLGAVAAPIGAAVLVATVLLLVGLLARGRQLA